MSTASPVPETWELDSDDARRTLAACGRRRLMRDAFVRLRVADGFSHARSLAYATALVLVQAVIAVVGLASAAGRGGFSRGIVRALRAAVPGPGGRLLTDAVTQAHRAGASHRYFGLLFGLLGALITGSTLMGQFERAMNRLYGVEQDRPTLRKYGLALLLTLTSGVLMIAAFALFAFGRTIGDAIDSTAMANAWAVLRWPAALVLCVFAITALFRWSPRRHQPEPSWLAYGAVVSTVLWTAVTISLGLFFSASASFGATYGPLAGLVALLLWALLSAVAVLYGAAIAAQLEAVRAGVAKPQDAEKVAHSDPDSDQGERDAGVRSAEESGRGSSPSPTTQAAANKQAIPSNTPHATSVG